MHLIVRQCRPAHRCSVTCRLFSVPAATLIIRGAAVRGYFHKWVWSLLGHKWTSCVFRPKERQNEIREFMIRQKPSFQKLSLPDAYIFDQMRNENKGLVNNLSYNVLQCVAVWCSVLQYVCVAVCCSVLQCVAVCCSVLQSTSVSASKVTV